MTIIKFNDIKIHPISSGADTILFYWEDRLFKAPHKKISMFYDLISEPFPLQQITKTDFILEHPEYGELPVFEMKIYKHLIKIQESVPIKVIEFIKAICKVNISLIKKGYVLRDIHEGNVYDSIDGIVWVDWGSIGLLNEALNSLTLTLYMANKYLYNTCCNETHQTYSISKAQNTKSAVTHIAKLNPQNIDTWVELFKTVEKTNIVSSPSHWADNYATNVTFENIENSNGKGKAVVEFLKTINYDTLTDVGCNKGYYTIYAAKKAKSSIGFDVDEKCISFAIKNTPQNLPVLFAKKDLRQLDTYEQTLRYTSDLVMALAISHHTLIPHIQFANILVSLSKKYILIEDIEEKEIYQIEFEKNGFVLVDRKISFPTSRTLSLYLKSGINDSSI